MQIKNYIVENYQLLMDCLEKELCQNGISYVRIDNEIHFLDKIIRFYDIDLDYQTICAWFFAKRQQEYEDRVSPYKLNYNHFKKHELVISSFSSTKSKKHPYDFNCAYQARDKYIQKQESNSVNQKLKRYSR